MHAFLALSTLTSLVMVSAFDFTVGVGKDETTGKKGLGFDPSVIHPQPGDSIVFEFRSGDHSAVESTFENPCTPKAGGFNSGVINVPDSTPVDASGLPQTRLLVNSTDPIWIFDQAGGLCQQGAVLAANPTSSQTAAAFKENASRASAPAPASTPPSAPSSASGAASSGGASTTSSGTPPAQSSPARNSGYRDAGVSVAAAFLGVVVGLL